MPLALLALPLLLACRPAAPAADPVVVLISWDTTRADALSCYAAELPWRPELSGVPAPSTPVADGLAAQGVRFAWALAHAPTTLASHTSLMSGQDSHGTAVVRNGTPVPAGLPLLAERFAAAGWDTLAVVGASTLSADMGLNRGFRIYDDAVHTVVRVRTEDDAAHVTARALAAVDQRRPGPLFLFVHYFDPHSPWDSAPAAVQARLAPPGSPTEPTALIAEVHDGTLTTAEALTARGMYLAEVAWADDQTGVLLDGLRARGLLDNALVALVADHGEALDDPGLAPYGHGQDVDLAAIHVPLLLRGTGRFALPAGTVVDRQVRLQDLGTTLLHAAALPGGALGAGQDLSPLWKAAAAGKTAPAAPPSFAEATKPERLESRTAWNNLPLSRSIAHDGLFLTLSPYRHNGATLYRLAAGQPRATPDPAAAADLVTRLRAWDQRAPPHRTVVQSEQTQEALRALGYVE